MIKLNRMEYTSTAHKAKLSLLAWCQTAYIYNVICFTVTSLTVTTVTLLRQYQCYCSKSRVVEIVVMVVKSSNLLIIEVVHRHYWFTRLRCKSD